MAKSNEQYGQTGYSGKPVELNVPKVTAPAGTTSDPMAGVMRQLQQFVNQQQRLVQQEEKAAARRRDPLPDLNEVAAAEGWTVDNAQEKYDTFIRRLALEASGGKLVNIDTLQTSARTRYDPDFDAWMNARGGATQQQKATSSGINLGIRDTAQSLFLGVPLQVGEFATGVAQLATGGNVPKSIVDWLGERRKGYESMFTPEAQEQTNRVKKAAETGTVTSTFQAIKDNPRVLTTMGPENIGLGVGAGPITKKLAVTAGAKLAGQASGVAQALAKPLQAVGKSNTLAGAVGEGLVGSGMSGYQLANDGNLSLADYLATLGIGVGTGLIGYGGGKLADATGLDNLETILMRSSTRVPAKSLVGATGKAFGTGVVEAGEEFLQEGLEQVLQNLAEGKPWNQGLAGAATLGSVLGFATGGVVSGIRSGVDAYNRRSEQQGVKLPDLKEFEERFNKVMEENENNNVPPDEPPTSPPAPPTEFTQEQRTLDAEAVRQAALDALGVVEENVIPSEGVFEETSPLLNEAATAEEMRAEELSALQTEQEVLPKQAIDAAIQAAADTVGQETAGITPTQEATLAQMEIQDALRTQEGQETTQEVTPSIQQTQELITPAQLTAQETPRVTQTTETQQTEAQRSQQPIPPETMPAATDVATAESISAEQPKFGGRVVNFDSLVDKALFLASDGRKSERARAPIKEWLKTQGIEDIEAASKVLRDRVQAINATQRGNVITVPERTTQPKVPIQPPITQQQPQTAVPSAQVTTQVAAQNVAGQSVFQQLQNTGFFSAEENAAYSELVNAFYEATASRIGRSVEQLWAQYPLEVRTEGNPGNPAYLQLAWQGTPHVFDKYSLQHVGTGEGAQVYGWGMYFASKKSVAEWYRDRLINFVPPEKRLIGIRKFNFRGDTFELRTVGSDNFLYIEQNGEFTILPEDSTILPRRLREYLQDDARQTLEESRFWDFRLSSSEDTKLEILAEYEEAFQALNELTNVETDSIVIEYEGKNYGFDFLTNKVISLQGKLDAVSRNTQEFITFFVRQLAESGGDIRSIRDLAESAIEDLGDSTDKRDIAYVKLNKRLYNALIDGTLKVKSKEYLAGISKGQLYKVEIPDNDVLLDYDKSLLEQNDNVKKLLGLVKREQQTLRLEIPVGNTVLSYIPAEVSDLAQTEKVVETIIGVIDKYNQSIKYSKDLLDILDKLSHGTTEVSPDDRVSYQYALNWLGTHSDIKMYGAGALGKPSGESLTIGNKTFPIYHYRMSFDTFVPTALGLGVAFPGNKTGAIFYNDIANEIGGDKEASLALQKIGLKGLRYLDGTSRSRGRGTHNFVIWDENVIDIISREEKLYEQKGKGAYYPGNEAVIGLFKGRDRSTFLHESGHFFLDMLEKLAPTNLEIAQDISILLEQAKFEGTVEDFINAPIKDKTPVHEAFARGFEQYLRVGQAPVSRLAGAFKQFSDWLKQIYKKLTTLGGKLNPSLKELYDRILTPQEKKAVEAGIPKVSDAAQIIADFIGAEATPEDTALKALDHISNWATDQLSKAADNVRAAYEKTGDFSTMERDTARLTSKFMASPASIKNANKGQYLEAVKILEARGTIDATMAKKLNTLATALPQLFDGIEVVIDKSKKAISVVRMAERMAKAGNLTVSQIASPNDAVQALLTPMLFGLTQEHKALLMRDYIREVMAWGPRNMTTEQAKAMVSLKTDMDTGFKWGEIADTKNLFDALPFNDPVRIFQTPESFFLANIPKYVKNSGFVSRLKSVGRTLLNVFRGPKLKHEGIQAILNDMLSTSRKPTMQYRDVLKTLNNMTMFGSPTEQIRQLRNAFIITNEQEAQLLWLAEKYPNIMGMIGYATAPSHRFEKDAVAQVDYSNPTLVMINSSETVLNPNATYDSINHEIMHVAHRFLSESTLRKISFMYQAIKADIASKIEINPKLRVYYGLQDGFEFFSEFGSAQLEGVMTSQGLPIHTGKLNTVAASNYIAAWPHDPALTRGFNVQAILAEANANMAAQLNSPIPFVAFEAVAGGLEPLFKRLSDIENKIENYYKQLDFGFNFDEDSLSSMQAERAMLILEIERFTQQQELQEALDAHGTIKNEQALRNIEDHQINSEQFKSRFGDWRSIDPAKSIPNTKIVRKNGKPLKVFHGGTYKDGPFRDGYLFFSQSREEAQSFANDAAEDTGEKASVLAGYLNFENPFIINTIEGHYAGRPNNVPKWFNELGDLRKIVELAEPNAFQDAQNISDNDLISHLVNMSSVFGEQLKEFVSRLRREGYDGVVFPHMAGVEETAFIASDSNDFIPSKSNVSKVVDMNGRPELVYHAGTFDPATSDARPGTHFGTRRAAEQRDANVIFDRLMSEVTYHEVPGGGFTWDMPSNDFGFETNGAVYRDRGQATEAATKAARGIAAKASVAGLSGLTTRGYYLDIKNPMRVNDQGGKWDLAIKQAKAQGYDGIVYENQFEDKGSDSWIIFNSSQVIPATVTDDHIGQRIVSNRRDEVAEARRRPEIGKQHEVARKPSGPGSAMQQVEHAINNPVQDTEALPTYAGWSLMQKLAQRTATTLSDAYTPIRRWAERLPTAPALKQQLIDTLYIGQNLASSMRSDINENHGGKEIQLRINQVAKKIGIAPESVLKQVGIWLTANWSKTANQRIQAFLESQVNLAEYQKRISAIVNNNQLQNWEKHYAVEKEHAKFLQKVQNLQDFHTALNTEAAVDKHIAQLAGGMNTAQAQQILALVESKIPKAYIRHIGESVWQMNTERLLRDIEGRRVTMDDLRKFVPANKQNQVIQLAERLIREWRTASDFDGASMQRVNTMREQLRGLLKSEYVPFYGALDGDSSTANGRKSITAAPLRLLEGSTYRVPDDGITTSYQGLESAVKYARWQPFTSTLFEIADGLQPSQVHAAGLSKPRAVQDNESPTFSNTIRVQDADGNLFNVSLQSGVLARILAEPIPPRWLQSDVTKAGSWVTRKMGYMITQLNPGFGPVNMLRDIQERVSLMASRDYIRADGSNINSAKLAARTLALAIAKGTEYARAGFTWGQNQQFINTVAGNFLRSLNRQGGLTVYAQQFGRDNTIIRQTGFGHTFDSLARFVSAYNNAYNVVPILASYEAMLEAGMSEQRAAAETLDLANFNKVGTSGPMLSALYAFSRSAFMGGSNFFRTIYNPTTGKLNRKGIATLAAATLLYAALWSMAADLSDDDEGGNKLLQLSDASTASSFMFPMGNGFGKVPVAFGLMRLANSLGKNLVQMERGYKDPTAALLATTVNGMMPAITPFMAPPTSAVDQPLFTLVNSIMPTSIQPALLTAFNKTPFGNELDKTPMKGFTLSTDPRFSGAETWRDIAEAFTSLTGHEVSPDAVKQMIEGYLPGVGNELIDAFINNPARESMGRVTQTPFLNRFWVEYDPGRKRMTLEAKTDADKKLKEKYDRELGKLNVKYRGIYKLPEAQRKARQMQINTERMKIIDKLLREAS